MARTSVLGEVLDAVLRRPESMRTRRRRNRGIDTSEIGFSRGFRPNAPRMVTVIASVVCCIVGVSLTVRPIQWVNDLLADAGLDLTQDQAYLVLLIAPLLLVAGSLLRGL